MNSLSRYISVTFKIIYWSGISNTNLKSVLMNLKFYMYVYHPDQDIEYFHSQGFLMFFPSQ